MNTSHFSQNPDSHEPGSPQNPVQETAVEAAPAAAVPQAIVPESAAPEAVVPASVAPQLPVTPQTAPTAGARPAIEIRGLTKAFGQKVAVDRINLDIPSGSFYGLVGRNGAGKTTTISMVTGMLMPSEGTAYVRGIDMWADPLKAKAHLGVLPDGVHLFDKLTGEQLITYSGYLHGIDKETVASRVKDLLAAMDLTDAAGRAVADYSAGMTKKIALAAALVHAPSVLILDEPFEAVDPVSAANIQDILRGFVASGGTVIISSHVMDPVSYTHLRRIEQFLSQNTYTAKQFTGVEGSTVPLKDTIESFQMICNGDVDHIPEQAFYNIGGMDDVMRRYEEIKAQTGAK